MEPPRPLPPPFRPHPSDEELQRVFAQLATAELHATVALRLHREAQARRTVAWRQLLGALGQG